MPVLAPCPDRTHPTYHDDVNIDAWVWWLIGAAGLGIPLVLTALPEFGMFAVGALAAAGAAALGGGAVAQVLVFVIVSVALIAVVRPIANRHRDQRPQHRSGIEALKGRSAVVLERVDGSGGRIKLAGEVWSARTLDVDSSFEPGQSVDVVDIDGATAVVM
ncbi:membrane protein [Streptomyces lavendulae subsp. lavendulae]|nr:membrane protein implicated in regulation of membrane protease activity [Streptomyces sp. SPB4]GLV82483.1 membrane protein [Streptomyces lavendulae subsp. lavendulae]GLX36268.1 membrane protein [Streptomyces roseochromogenus]